MRAGLFVPCYMAAVDTADEALRLLPHVALANPSNTWTSKGRDVPEAPSQSFHAWWPEHRAKARNSA
jgi:L-lactate dehydrogenase complex protein LldF